MRGSWLNFWSRLRGRGEPSRVLALADFRERMEAELRVSGARPVPFSLVHLSVDSYGDVLHRHGIEAAARLLDAATAVLIEQTSAPAVVARGRVPELALLLPNTDAASARTLFDRIRTALDAAGAASVSTGIVTSIDHSLATPQVLQLAYQAMYDAQREEVGHVDHLVIENLRAIPYLRSPPGSGPSQAQPPDPRGPDHNLGHQDIEPSPRRVS